MEDWLDIINDDKQNDGLPDDIILPSPQIIDLNPMGTLQKEISYRFDENNPENVVRTERTFEIISTKKKISNAAIKRKKHWVKFGQSGNIPKGKIERGVTNQREGNFPFLFNGIKVKKQIKKEIKPKPIRKMNDDDNKGKDPNLEQKKTGYIPVHLRDRGSNIYSSVFNEDDKVEIKISNLPQWANWNDVKQIIDAFYRVHLHQKYIPKYRIRMIPSKKTLEQWNADPISWAHRLAEYERLAIVEFENEQNAKKAIKLLDGHHYDSHILRVEKAKPRR